MLGLINLIHLVQIHSFREFPLKGFLLASTQLIVLRHGPFYKHLCILIIKNIVFHLVLIKYNCNAVVSYEGYDNFIQSLILYND